MFWSLRYSSLDLQREVRHRDGKCQLNNILCIEDYKIKVKVMFSPSCNLQSGGGDVTIHQHNNLDTKWQGKINANTIASDGKHKRTGERD